MGFLLTKSFANWGFPTFGARSYDENLWLTNPLSPVCTWCRPDGSLLVQAWPWHFHIKGAIPLRAESWGSLHLLWWNTSNYNLHVYCRHAQFGWALVKMSLVLRKAETSPVFGGQQACSWVSELTGWARNTLKTHTPADPKDLAKLAHPGWYDRHIKNDEIILKYPQPWRLFPPTTQVCSKSPSWHSSLLHRATASAIHHLPVSMWNIAR